MPLTNLSWIVTVPALPIRSSTTPFQASRPASVTTNDGMPTLANSVPWIRPIVAPAPSARRMASGTETWLPSGCSSNATITPPTPLTKPTDRSISPSSRTKTIPMPITANGASWISRLTKLPAVRKFELRAWK